MESRNLEKATLLYKRIDATGYFRGHAETGSRSTMNVAFNLPTPDLEQKFIGEASAAGLDG